LVLGWAETPYGVPALFLMAFAESSFFPIPPDVLLIALALAIPKRSFRFAAYATLGSVLGGFSVMPSVFGATNGLVLTSSLFITGKRSWRASAISYGEYGFWGILTAAVTPIPYKIFTIASGVFAFPFASFLGASIVGRALRFFVIALLIWQYGPPVKRFIDKYFNWLAIAFIILLVGGFYLISRLT
jgi:membrane protein YqaA with SNARE-associated domain